GARDGGIRLAIWDRGRHGAVQVIRRGDERENTAKPQPARLSLFANENIDWPRRAGGEPAGESAMHRLNRIWHDEIRRHQRAIPASDVRDHECPATNRLPDAAIKHVL